jgi:hypothetical protein
MKKILNILVLFSLVFIYSCDDNADFNIEDPLTEGAGENGAIVDVRSASTGKLLGVPSSQDFATATVAFAENLLDLEVFLLSGGTNVTSYEITKSINGGPDVTAAVSPSLPINLSYSSVAEFLDGLGLSESDLRIGDVVTFRTKFVHADGSTSFSGPNDGTYSVTVSCSSDLAGSYNLTMVSSNGWNINFPNEQVSEKGVGLYKTESTYRWAVGSIAPDQGFDFTDVCGSLNVASQGLAQGFYSNEVKGTAAGTVDGATGDLRLEYYVAFSGGATLIDCVGTYIKL